MPCSVTEAQNLCRPVLSFCIVVFSSFMLHKTSNVLYSRIFFLNNTSNFIDFNRIPIVYQPTIRHAQTLINQFMTGKKQKMSKR